MGILGPKWPKFRDLGHFLDFKSFYAILQLMIDNYVCYLLVFIVLEKIFGPKIESFRPELGPKMGFG